MRDVLVEYGIALNQSKESQRQLQPVVKSSMQKLTQSGVLRLQKSSENVDLLQISQIAKSITKLGIKPDPKITEFLVESISLFKDSKAFLCALDN